MIVPNWCQISLDTTKKILSKTEDIFGLKNGSTLYTPLLNLFVENNVKFKRLNNSYLMISIGKLIKKINTNCFIYKIEIEKKRKGRRNINEIRKAFIKEIPLINLNYSKIYQLYNKKPIDLKYLNFNITENIWSINNPAYIEQLCSYLLSNLVENDICPHFPLYYGSVFGFKQNFGYFKNKISSDYLDNISDNYTLINDNEGEIVYIPDIPTQILITEDVGIELYNLIYERQFNYTFYKSIFFQVSAALNIIQTKYQMTHNDLHINNIMCKYTKKKYLYYKYNNQLFKVPTFGIIVKIIDWGRGLLKLNDQLLWNNIYNTNNSASGQYKNPKICFNKSKEYTINRSFDITIFSYSFLNELKQCNILKWNKFTRFLYKNCQLSDKLTTNIYDKYNINNKLSFQMYLDIVKYQNINIPINIINNEIFNNFKYTILDYDNVKKIKYYLLQ